MSAAIDSPDQLVAGPSGRVFAGGYELVVEKIAKAEFTVFTEFLKFL
jgi:hypothetical protein